MLQINLYLHLFLSFYKIGDFWDKFSGKPPSMGYAMNANERWKTPFYTRIEQSIAYRLSSHFGAKKKSNTKTNLLKILTRGIPVKIIYLFYIYISLSSLLIHTITIHIFYLKLQLYCSKVKVIVINLWHIILITNLYDINPALIYVYILYNHLKID